MQAKFGKVYGETGRCSAGFVMLFDAGIEYIYW